MRALRRVGSVLDSTQPRGRGSPVMLVTLGVPFDEEAAAFAVDSAVEAGQPLLVVNVVELVLGLWSVALRYGDIDDDPEDAEALRAPALLAAKLGVEVERLRVQSPHPLDALVEIVGEREPGLVVFGPDRERMKPRAYRKAAEALRSRATCLVWLAD